MQLCTAPSTTNVLFLICNIHMLLFRRFSPSNSTDGIPFYVPPRECQVGSGTFNFFLTRCQAYYEILSTYKQQGLSRILLTLAFSFCLLFRTRLVVANESSLFCPCLMSYSRMIWKFRHYGLPSHLKYLNTQDFDCFAATLT